MKNKKNVHKCKFVCLFVLQSKSKLSIVTNKDNQVCLSSEGGEGVAIKRTMIGRYQCSCRRAFRRFAIGCNLRPRGQDGASMTCCLF